MGLQSYQTWNQAVLGCALYLLGIGPLPHHTIALCSSMAPLEAVNGKPGFPCPVINRRLDMIIFKVSVENLPDLDCFGVLVVARYS